MESPPMELTTKPTPSGPSLVTAMAQKVESLMRGHSFKYIISCRTVQTQCASPRQNRYDRRHCASSRQRINISTSFVKFLDIYQNFNEFYGFYGFAEFPKDTASRPHLGKVALP